MHGKTRGVHRKIKRAQREKDAAQLIATVERQADPFEQAKVHLRAKGYIVAPSTQDPTLWTVGARLFQTARQLVELAERLGWKAKPVDLQSLNRRIGR